MKRRKRELWPEPKGLKHDPVEETEAFKAIVEEVNKEAESLVDPSIRFARFSYVEREKKRILKERYNIDWKTTEEMNPDWDLI